MKCLRRFFILLLLVCLVEFSSCRSSIIAQGSWEALADSPLEGRKDGVAVWTGTTLIIWGGDGATGSVNTGASYDSATGLWTSLATGDGVPSHRTDLMDFRGVWTGNRMLVWGGRSSDGEYSDQSTNRQIRSDGGIYDPTTDTWTAIAENSVSPGRAYVQGVWADTTMIVFAGNDETAVSESMAISDPALGAIYNPGNFDDPTDDTWTALSVTDAPSQRKHGAVVWTGDKLLTWGGAYAHEVFYNDGALYDPTTDTWTAMSSTNAPSERELFAAVWTGEKLLVWGGFNGVESLSDGGIYDLATNTWSSISAVNTPSARASVASSVWTGAELLVWGGVNMTVDDFGNSSTTYLGDGGIYSLADNTWTPMKSNDSFSKRRPFLTIWTGTQMIVWGGYDGTNYYNDGAVFTP